ncbi:hypothetical protein F4780DRAFT_742473 [Xylariomycetidae sp. FL0641]|nr:hypothetical protein F4780DRAFT_742473 [Xylariomycetidae sp. FL0641]
MRPSFTKWHPRFVQQGSLARYASVCRGWQQLVEPITFRHIRLTTVRLTEARQIITPERRCHIGSIDLDLSTMMLRQPRHGSTIYESRTTFPALCGLFNDLFSTWSCSEVRQEGIQLSVHTPTDWDFSQHSQNAYVEISDDLVPARFISYFGVSDRLSALQYEIDTRTESWFPEDYFVSASIVRSRYDEPALCLGSSAWRSLRKALPAVKTVECKSYAWGATQERHRCEQKAFLRSLQPTVKHLIVRLHDSFIWQTPPSYSDDEEWTSDFALSSVLRGISHQLTSLKVIGSFNREIFWPLGKQEEQPHWPTLTFLDVYLCFLLPTIPGSYQSMNWPSESALNDLHVSIAKAASQMPRIEFLRVGHRVTSTRRHEVSLEVTDREAIVAWICPCTGFRERGCRPAQRRFQDEVGVGLEISLPLPYRDTSTIRDAGSRCGDGKHGLPPHG